MGVSVYIQLQGETIVANIPNDRNDLEGDGHRLLTVIAAADYLAISRGSVYHMLDDGRLRSVRIGRARRIALAELRRLVDDLSDTA